MATYMDAVNGNHTDGREQGANSARVRYVHIVQVHPVELGLPNLHKVKEEKEFVDKEVAIHFMQNFNDKMYDLGEDLRAVYLGRVNHETGELE